MNSEPAGFAFIAGQAGSRGLVAITQKVGDNPRMTEAALHHFETYAFPENFSLRELAPAWPGSRLAQNELQIKLAAEATLFLYSFGAAVFENASPESVAAALRRLHEVRPGLSADPIRENFTVAVDAGGEPPRLREGRLHLDQLTRERAGVIALTLAQSAATEYYERIVESLFKRTGELVARLEARGTVPLRVKPLNRFIGEAVGTRSEVLSILHLLDKPDATWDDPAMDRIYADLRTEFDLGDRYEALALKLRAVQEALELLLDVARDRRLFLLESLVVILILGELLAWLFMRK